MFQDIAKMIRLARKCVIASEIAVIKKLGEIFQEVFHLHIVIYIFI